MDTSEYLEYLRADGEALAAAARRAPDAHIGSCPEWDMTDLLAHVGGVHRWVDEMVTAKASKYIPRHSPELEGFEDTLAWYEEGLAHLLATLAAADPEEPVWNWADRKPAPALFWIRRMALETAIHRWDGEGGHVHGGEIHETADDHEGHDHGHEAHDHEAHDHGHEAHDHEAHDHEADDQEHEAHGHEAHGHEAHGHEAHGHEAHEHEAHEHEAHGHEAHEHEAQGGEVGPGRPQPIATDLAVDGIDEYLGFVGLWLAYQPVPGLEGSLHLHATDTAGEWSMVLSPEAMELRREHVKSDVAIRASASDLLLWLLNRVPADSPSLKVFGESEIVELWRSLQF